MDPRTERLERLISTFYKSKRQAALAFNVTPSHISNITLGTRPLTGDIIVRVADHLSVVNIDWLLHGRGEMLYTEKTQEVPSDGPAVEIQGEPTQSQIEQLTDYTLTVQPSELTARQRLMLQLACAHVLKENQGLHSLEYLSMASRAYLRLIVRFPDFNLVSLFDLEGALRLQV